ncbi:hypothetical protein AMECASPLE_010508, partial [Ameca splendens]
TSFPQQHTPERLSTQQPSIIQHKSNKTRLCKYFSGLSTPSKVLLLAVCLLVLGGSHCAPHCRLFCVGLLDMAGLLWKGSSASMHAAAEDRICADVSLCVTGCQVCSAALAQNTHFTSFDFDYSWLKKI